MLKTFNFFSQSLSVNLEDAAAGVLPGVEAGQDANAAFGAMLSDLLGFLLIVATLMVFVYFIWAAFEWITAAGDKGKLTSAQQRMTNAVMGLFLLTGVLAVMMFIQMFLGINIISVPGGGTGGSGGSGGGSGQTCNPPGIYANDGSAGRYCTKGGQFSPARVRCYGPGAGVSGFDYNHWEPCECLDGGQPLPQYTFNCGLPPTVN